MRWPAGDNRKNGSQGSDKEVGIRQAMIAGLAKDGLGKVALDQKMGFIASWKPFFIFGMISQ